GTELLFALARYNADGSLDGSFGTGGKATTAFGTSYSSAFAVALQGDGDIVAAGNTFSGAYQDFGLARYQTDGSRDGSVGTGGTVATAFGTSDDLALAVVLQGDGRIVAVGETFNGSNADFALARYLNNVCGNSIVEPGEQCDDGAANGTPTSCCTSSCATEPDLSCHQGEVVIADAHAAALIRVRPSDGAQAIV